MKRTLHVLIALSCALAVSIPSAGPALAVQPGYDDDLPPGPLAAWDTRDDAVFPSPTGARPDSISPQAADDCLGKRERDIRYTSDGVIHVEGCGQTFRLSDIAAVADMSPGRIELVDPANKIWLLKVRLKVEEGATLRVVGGAGGDANWLRLRSDAADAVWLRAENGALLFQDTKVTSWDTRANAPDADPAVAADGSGGRAYIAARSVLTRDRQTTPPTACSVEGGSREPYEGRMDVLNSEIGYLGYNAGESYGMTWKVYYKVNPADPSDAPPPGRQLYAMVDIFGDVGGSLFHHNYFGAYTYGAYCMRWANNTFAENVQYGLDPHDDSDDLTIENNVFRDNGNHGVICSIECDRLVIRNNQSLRNLHGIMLHRNVNGALVEGNIVRDNRQAGIAIFDSHDAVVRDNTVENNAEAAIRLSVGASRNLIEQNTLTGLAASATGPGYVVYTYKGTDPPTSGDGLPKHNTFRNNRLTGYKNPLFKIGEATGNVFEGNTLAGPAVDMSFVNATGNVVRDAEIGVPFRVVLESASTARLEDSRGVAWLLSRPELPTIASPDGSSLDLTYANAGPALSATPIDLSVRPRSGTVAVRLASWDTGARRWSVSGSGGEVTLGVGQLQPAACYGVIANDQAIDAFTAGADGRIGFSYTLAGPTKFALEASADCAAPVPTPAPKFALLMPLVRR